MAPCVQPRGGGPRLPGSPTQLETTAAGGLVTRCALGCDGPALVFPSSSPPSHDCHKKELALLSSMHQLVQLSVACGGERRAAIKINFCVQIKIIPVDDLTWASPPCVRPCVCRCACVGACGELSPPPCRCTRAVHPLLSHAWTLLRNPGLLARASLLRWRFGARF